jgi:hypothetical protein
MSMRFAHFLQAGSRDMAVEMWAVTTVVAANESHKTLVFVNCSISIADIIRNAKADD